MTDALNKLSPKDFLERSKSIPVVDVRSPNEYLMGHIPGAVSTPLFDDDERAVVGTTYTRIGRDEALLKGLEFVGPKMKDFVQKAKQLAETNEILVHCWRGGMRSGAMAWLFGFSGIKASVLEGGYKAYRHYIRESLSMGPIIKILGGMTGSGKTEILHRLDRLGEQVLDLEGLANHKGSAFGALGQLEQPTTEQFENNLAEKWLSFDPDKPVWVEDESRSIGRVIIPDPFLARMADAKVIFIEVPFETRVNRLFEEYGGFDTQQLIAIVQRISKRMGGGAVKAATEDLQSGNIKEAVAQVLKYYDRTYRYGISKRDKSKVTFLSSEEFLYSDLFTCRKSIR